MKWYEVNLQSFEGKVRSQYIGSQHGTSLDDAMIRVMTSFRKSGWIAEDVTKFSIELQFDERRTKLFDEQDMWGPYL